MCDVRSTGMKSDFCVTERHCVPCDVLLEYDFRTLSLSGNTMAVVCRPCGIGQWSLLHNQLLSVLGEF
jgi:hypothetical protein